MFKLSQGDQADSADNSNTKKFNKTVCLMLLDKTGDSTSSLVKLYGLRSVSIGEALMFRLAMSSALEQQEMHYPNNAMPK